jgi:hypothetical protein
MLRTPLFDPRTIARDIPGLLDSVFPQLTPGVVAHLNHTAEWVPPAEAVPQELVALSKLQHAMLFELGVAVGEDIIQEKTVDWDACIARAVARQRRHFDAKIPALIDEVDKKIAMKVGVNLSQMLAVLDIEQPFPIITAPTIPGFQWIASGSGDFSIGRSLVEVKCTNKGFSSADVRQVMMYWLLSLAASLERVGDEWAEAILLNPRKGTWVRVDYAELLALIGAGRTKIEALELFSALIQSRHAQ